MAMKVVHDISNEKQVGLWPINGNSASNT